MGRDPPIKIMLPQNGAGPPTLCIASDRLSFVFGGMPEVTEELKDSLVLPINEVRDHPLLRVVDEELVLSIYVPIPQWL